MDGFDWSGRQVTTDTGLSGWTKGRDFDNDAYNVRNLNQRVEQNQDKAAQYAYHTRARQTTLADALAAQASGKGPSLANAQLQQGTDRNIQAQMAMAASQRGAGAAGAGRQLAYQQAASRQQMAGDAATLRLNEQMQAQNQLGGLLAGMRGADDQQNRYFEQQANDLYTQQMQARQARESLGVQYDLGLRGVAVNGQGQAMQAAGSGLAALGGLAFLASDERLKKDIEPGGKDLGAFLDALSSNKYKYKDEKHGKGEFYSPMAQDLEKTPVGRSMVEDTPEGKMVNYSRGLGALLAGLADTHQRVKKLEGKGASNG